MNNDDKFWLTLIGMSLGTSVIFMGLVFSYYAHKNVLIAGLVAHGTPAMEALCSLPQEDAGRCAMLLTQAKK